MALKSTAKLAEDIKVGDIITNYNVMQKRVDKFVISLVRNTGDRFAFNYADPDTGQQVNYFTAQRGETIFVITED